MHGARQHTRTGPRLARQRCQRAAAGAPPGRHCGAGLPRQPALLRAPAGPPLRAPAAAPARAPAGAPAGAPLSPHSTRTVRRVSTPGMARRALLAAAPVALAPAPAQCRAPCLQHGGSGSVRAMHRRGCHVCRVHGDTPRHLVTFRSPPPTGGCRLVRGQAALAGLLNMFC